MKGLIYALFSGLIYALLYAITRNLFFTFVICPPCCFIFVAILTIHDAKKYYGSSVDNTK